MKTLRVLYSLLLALLFSPSCTKEKESCVATLNLFFENSPVGIEWMEVEAGRQDRSGEITINARGYNDEHFILHLLNVSDTGTITGITLSQLSFSDGVGFHPQQIQKGFIRIAERNENSLSGEFDVFFTNHRVTASPLRAEGSFRVFGRN